MGDRDEEEGLPSNAEALERVNRFLEGMQSGDSKGWGHKFFAEGLSVLSASASPIASVYFEYTCHEDHANRAGNLHGGCAATLYDFCTSMALVPISKPGFWTFVGVSRTLNVTYLRPMPIGETAIIECEVVAVGKRLATMKGTMKRKRDGVILSIAEHGKVNTDPAPERL